MADNEKIDDRKANADWFTLFLAGAFGGGGVDGSAGDDLQLETGDYLLLETGDFFLLE